MSIRLFTALHAAFALYTITLPITTTTEQPEPAMYNLASSTAIIMQLLRADKLGDILEQHTPEQLDILIKNYSPALMAFESEVLSCTLPVVLYFYRATDLAKAATDAFMEQLAYSHTDSIKVVAIDADAFFSIAQAAEIDNTPTFVLCRDRTMQEYVTGAESIAKVTALMQIK